MVQASNTFGILRRAGSGMVGGAVVLSLALAGCSADVTRLESPFYGFGGEDAPRAAARPDPVPSVGIYDGGGSAGAPGRAAYGNPDSGNGVERSNLPSVGRPGYEDVSPGVAHKRPKPIPSFDRQEVASAAPRPVGDSGRSIIVGQGDTLYGIARRYGTTVAALQDANGINGAMLKPGQKLLLPAGASSGSARPQAVAAAPAVAGRQLRLSEPTAPTGDIAWEGSYTVQSGDSLYNIAKSKGVSVADLKRANGIDDPRRLKPGLVLKVPGKGEPQRREDEPVKVSARSESVAAPESRRSEAPAPAKMVGAPRNESEPEATGGPKILNGTESGGEREDVAKTVVATNSQTKSDAGEVRKSGKLRWPVVGRIVSGFGKRKDGSHNDGIDIAVPPGTDVRAAEDGVVAYSGSEVKGFGNLLLVRHENGIVTAYAHNDKLLVQRGDRVRRGQVVAKSGSSGGADQPLVHFEVRNGSKPVDPIGHLEKL